MIGVYGWDIIRSLDVRCLSCFHCHMKLHNLLNEFFLPWVIPYLFSNFPTHTLYLSRFLSSDGFSWGIRSTIWQKVVLRKEYLWMFPKRHRYVFPLFIKTLLERHWVSFTAKLAYACSSFLILLFRILVYIILAHQCKVSALQDSSTIY